MTRQDYPECCYCGEPIKDETCICLDRYWERESCFHERCFWEQLKDIKSECIRDILTEDIMEKITTPIREEEVEPWPLFPHLEEELEDLHL